MAQIIKTYIGVFLLLIVVFVGGSLITVSIDGTNAQRYLSDMVDVMEADNFSDTTVNDCINKVNNHTDAQAKHYSNLQVKTLANPNDPYSNGREVTMEYEFSIPLLNFNNQKHIVRAVAR